jgi:uncharacterized protein YjbJ (UPF0337 family)
MEVSIQMKTEQIKDSWQQVRVQFQESWTALTDDDIQASLGRRQWLVSKIQEKYGLSKEQAENALKDWEIQHRSFL